MAYTIIKTNGTVLATIPDGTVNTTSTSLQLPGRNYSGYGQVMDTNFVRVLENFADSNVPRNALKGQLWYNTSEQSLYVCKTDGETDPNNWLKIVSTADINFSNLVISGNLYADNALLTGNVIANAGYFEYLTVNVSANINDATLSGVTNIAELTVGGNVTLSSSPAISLGAVGNIHITGGISGYQLTTDGAGELSWQSPVTAAGSNTQIQYNENGNFGSSADFNYNQETGTLGVPNITVSGNVLGVNLIEANKFIGSGANLANINGANITGQVANATVAATVYSNSQPNITSVGTLVNLTVTGNANVGNTVRANTVTANFVVGNGYQLTNLLGSRVVGEVANANYATYTTTANTAITVTANAQPNITSVGSLTGLSVSGNIVAYNIGNVNTVSANYFMGNGITLTAVNGANVVGTVPYANYANGISPGATLSVAQGGTGANTITQAGQNLGSLGFGATWRSVSTDVNVVRQNTNGKPIQVVVQYTVSANPSGPVGFQVSETGAPGTWIWLSQTPYTEGPHASIYIICPIIPPGWRYQMFSSYINKAQINYWNELY